MRANRFEDIHHTLNYEREWLTRPEGEALRENPSLKVKIARTAHNLLHYMTSPVPVPSVHTLQYVAPRMPEDLDILSGIDKYCSLVEAASRHPKAKYVEKQLGELSIQALRDQIPYIIDGLPNEQRRYFV